MIPYFALASATVFLSGLNRAAALTVHRHSATRDVRADRTSWTILDFLILGLLIAFSGLRWQVGTDYNAYARMFVNMHPTHWAEQLQASPQEFGYTLMALFIRQFSATPEPLFWLTSALTVIPIYLTLKKNSADMTMSLALYVLLAFYVSPFNIIRQGIAISLSFWAASFIDSNKKLFCLLNAIAATFHATAIFAALIQLLFRNRRPTTGLFLSVIGGALLAAAALPRLGGVLAFLEVFNERYDAHLVGAAAGIGTYLLIFSRLGLGFYAALLGDSDRSYRYLTYVLIGVGFLIIGTQSIVISRMQAYFGIFLLLLLPNQIAGRTDQLVHKVFLYAVGAIYFWFHLQNWGGLVPYQMAP